MQPALQQRPPSYQSSSTVRNSSYPMAHEASDSDVSAPITELEPTDNREKGFQPINVRAGEVNGNASHHRREAQIPHQVAPLPQPPPQQQPPPQHQQQSAPQDLRQQILSRLAELEKLDSVRSEHRAHEIQRRHQEDEEIRIRRGHEDEWLRNKRAEADDLFAKSEQELDAEEDDLRRKLKLIKRGLPVDSPLPPTRVSSYIMATSPPTHPSPLAPNQPIRFDPFAKEPAAYPQHPAPPPPTGPASVPPSAPPIAAVPAKYQPPHQGQQSPHVQSPSMPYQSGHGHRPPHDHARPPSGPPPSHQPPPPVSGFAAVNRAPPSFAPVNAPIPAPVQTPMPPQPPPTQGPPPHPGLAPAPGTPVYNDPNSRNFQTHKHYSPMNPPPSLNKPPGVQRTETPPSVSAKRERGPSTHPYMYSEAFAKRHVKCDREDQYGRGIWHHDTSNTDRYIRCWHDNCGRMDWKTLHGFACHIVRRHDLPKGTLQGIQDCLEKYGVEVGTEGPPPPPTAPTPRAANRKPDPKPQQPSAVDDDDAMYSAPYRIQGATQEEYVYSSDSDSDEESREQPTPGMDTTREVPARDSEVKIENPHLPGRIPIEIESGRRSTTVASPEQSQRNFAPITILKLPRKAAQGAPNSQHQTNSPSLTHTTSTATPLATSSMPPPSAAPSSEDTLKLARAALQANDQRSQEDSDYVPSQSIVPETQESGFRVDQTIASTPAQTAQNGDTSTMAETVTNSASTFEPSSKETTMSTPFPSVPPLDHLANSPPIGYPNIKTDRPKTPPPNLSEQQAKNEPVSPYRARISIEGMARDAAKRMIRRDEEDSDYAETQEALANRPKSAGRSPRSARKSSFSETVGSSMVPDSMELDGQSSTPAKRGTKRPATSDSSASKQMNGTSPHKTRRTASRSLSGRTASPFSIHDESGGEAGSKSTSKTTIEDTDPTTNSTNDNEDSIHITQPPSRSGTLPTVAPASNSSSSHSKPRRHAATVASDKWSKLVTQPRVSTRGAAKEITMTMDEIRDSGTREKVKKLMEVVPGRSVVDCMDALDKSKRGFEGAVEMLMESIEGKAMRSGGGGRRTRRG
ncbi:MAG: hypothetical protein Q9227_007437 [Pyrenula ochraceoflavens]